MHNLPTFPPFHQSLPSHPHFSLLLLGLKAGEEDGPGSMPEKISLAEGNRTGRVWERHGWRGSRGPMDMDMNMVGWNGMWNLGLGGWSYSGQDPNKPCLHCLVPHSECPSSQRGDIPLDLVVLWRPPPYYVDFYQPGLKGLAMCSDFIQTRSFPLFLSFYH